MLTGVGTVFLGFAALGGILLVVRLPSTVIQTDPTWRAMNGWAVAWKRETFDDTSWTRANPAAFKGYEVDQIGIPAIGDSCVPSVRDSCERTYRRSFPVHFRALVSSATLMSYADDDHEVFLNGIPIVVDANNKAGPLVITNVTELLKGENVLVVRTRNLSGRGFFLAKLVIRHIGIRTAGSTE